MRLGYLVQWWMMDARSHRVIIVGAGFAGLAAAYDLACKGYGVTVLEKENEVGGLAAGFPLDGYRLEKFYHHWFVHDTEIMELVRELGVEDQVALRPARTGVYCRGRVYRFSTPLDLLRFKPLRFRDPHQTRTRRTARAARERLAAVGRLVRWRVAPAHVRPGGL